MVNYCISFKGTTYRMARWTLERRTEELVKAMYNLFSPAGLALIIDSLQYIHIDDSKEKPIFSVVHA